MRATIWMKERITFPALAYAFIILFLPFYEGGARPESLFIIHSAIFMLMFFLGFSFFRKNAYSLFFPEMVLLFVPFLIYMLVRSLLSPYIYSSLLSLWEVCMFLLLFSVTVHFSRSTAFGRSVLTIFFISGVAQAFIAIILSLQQGFKRSAAYFLNPNHFAAYLSITFFVGLFLLVALRRVAKKGRNVLLFIHMLALLLILAAFIGGSSRGALLAFCAALFMAILLLSIAGRKRESIVAIILITAIAATGAFFLFQRFSSGLDIYRYERVRIWKASFDIFFDNIFFGTAPGMFQFHAHNYNFPQLDSPVHYGRIFSTPHSDLLLALSELGIIGFVLLLFPAVYILIAFTWRRAGGGGDPSDRTEALFQKIAIASILVAFFTQGLFDTLTERPALYMSLSIVAGVLLRDFMKRDLEELYVRHLSRRSILALFLLLPFVYLYLIAVFNPFVADISIRRGNALYAEEKRSEKYDVREAQKKMIETIRYCSQAIFFNPLQPDYYDLRGRSAMELLESERSFLNSHSTFDSVSFIDQNFSRAASLNRVNSSYHVNRARAYREFSKRGFFPENSLSMAIGFYRDAEDLSRNDPFIPYELATIFFDHGDLESAEREALKGLSIEPYFFQCSLLLAHVCAEAGNATRAAEIMEVMERKFSAISGYKIKNRYEFDVLQYDREKFLALKQKLKKEDHDVSAP